MFSQVVRTSAEKEENMERDCPNVVYVCESAQGIQEKTQSKRVMLLYQD